MQEQHYIQPIQHWLEHTVIGLNLCPFAKREWIKNRIHYAVETTTEPTKLVSRLKQELQRLVDMPSIETSLIIVPNLFTDFTDYNDFLDLAEACLDELELISIIQIASFHPDYQFADTQKNDAENYTNRSPYPLLHLLRETSLERAIAAYPNTEQIPENNIKLMNELGSEAMRQRLSQCFVSNQDRSKP